MNNNVVVVIGLGSMGKRRIRLLKKGGYADEVIGVDAREDRRTECNELHGIKTYESIEQALKENEDVQSAFVCTAPLSHNVIIKECLENNLNVFTELNLVTDGYDDNILLAKEKNKTLFLSSTFLYRDEISYIREKVKSVDRPYNYMYHVGQYLPDWHPWENYKDFFVGNNRTNGCRELLAIELPWICETFGKIKDFYITKDKMTNLKIDYKDNYMINITHSNGNKGLLLVDVVSPVAVRRLEVYSEKFYVSWNGTPESLDMYDESENKLKHVDLGNDIERIENYRAFIIENAYENEIREFFDVVNGKRSQLYGFEKDKKILDLIDKMEE